MFLNFGKSEPQRSYKHGSYKKKKVYHSFIDQTQDMVHTSSSLLDQQHFLPSGQWESTEHSGITIFPVMRLQMQVFLSAQSISWQVWPSILRSSRQGNVASP